MPGTRRPSIYEHEAYAAVCRRSHSTALAKFVLRAWRRFGPGSAAPACGLELACGVALLSVDLAQRGVEMTAVDRSRRILRAAARSAAAAGVRIALISADMNAYRARPRVDVAVNLGLNTSHVLSNADMLRHLDAVGRSLVAGGLYLIDFDFVLHRIVDRVVGCERGCLVYRTAPVYDQTLVDGARTIRLAFGVGEARYDPVRQIFRSTNLLVIRERGRTVEVVVPSAGKLYMPLEVEALVAQSGWFEVVGRYAGYALGRRLECEPGADRFVLALRRRR